MSAPAWMPFYVAHFVADTLHLSAEETGCYTLLIIHYWQHGGLPENETALARIARVTPDEWQKIRPTLAALFLDGWRHKRIACELEEAHRLISKRSAAGKAGARRRWHSKGLKRKDKERNAFAMANAKQTHIGNGIGIGTNLKTNSTEQKEASPRASDPVGYVELIRVLDDQRARAVIEARQKKRDPLTAYAAKLLAKRLEQFPSPNEAADEMVVRGWKSVKPEWLAERKPFSRPDPTKYVPPPPEPDRDASTRLVADQMFVDGFLNLHGEELQRRKQEWLAEKLGKMQWQ